MTPAALLLAVLMLLLAFGLVAWAWSTMARLRNELRAFRAAKRVDLASGPRMPQQLVRAKWPW